MNIQMNKDLLSLFNRQIIREIQSDILARQIASVFTDMGYEGFAYWFTSHADNEIKHKQKFISLVETHGDVVTFDTIPKISIEADKDKNVTVVSLVKQWLEFMIFIRDGFNEMCAKAYDVKDYTVVKTILWFADDQLQGLNDIDLIYRQVIRCEGCDDGYTLIDQSLKKK